MKTALILFADGSEELEAVTVINLLRRGGVTVVFAGLHEGPLRGSRGTVLVPDTTLDDVLDHDYDMVVLPGGQPGTNNLKTDARVLKLVRRMHEADKYVTAICAAPSVLATAGLLDGKHATSFPGSLDPFPKVLREPLAVVEDGKLITSRGPGTAMDFALTLVERLVGHAKRMEVEDGLVR
ncbi:protease [Ferrigenium kumadai]|uniref:Protease n=1 Tax=Ferrigenium kumadai TaxID=1682490 RepID=A0AAN1T0D3_9PROT|nr:DJ-1 family glyoxalase III [Ferrigenium kumadai]BBJ00118.1 protease [Ferrigenium kumadai]